MNSTQIVVAGVIWNDDKLLLTLRFDPDEPTSELNNLWQIPGGGLEFGETPEEALHREISEETGLNIDIERILPKVYTRVVTNTQLFFLSYECRPIRTDQKVVINNEALDFCWIQRSEIHTVSLTPLTRHILTECYT